MRGLLLLGCVCWACGASPKVEDANADAPEDAAPDVERDVGRDVGRDARRDTSEPDSETDSEIADAGPDPLGWTPLSGLPEGCVIEYAAHPEQLATMMWIEDARCGAGCRRLVARSETYQGGPMRATGTFDGDRGWFPMMFRRADLLDRGPRILAVADTEGTIHGAWRGPSLRDAGICAVDTPHTARGWVGFAAPIWVGDDQEERLYHAPVDALRNDLEPVGVYPPSASFPGSNALQNIRVSDSMIIAQVQPLGRIRVERPSGGYWLAGRGTPTPGSPQAVHVVGDHVLWLDWISSTGVRIAHEAQGGGEEVFYNPSDASIFGLSTDGETIVWMQTYGYIAPGVFDAQEIWWAPYARNPSELEPRRLLDQYPYNFGVAGAGYLVTHRRNEIIRFQIPGGEESRYTVPGPYWGNVTWVADDHVALVTSMDDEATLLIVPDADFVPVP